MQFVNRFTSDKTRSHGGTKIGDFGSGGRTYYRYRRHPGGFKDGYRYGSCGQWGLLVLVLAAAGLIFSEYVLESTLSMLDEALDIAVPINSSKALPSFESSVVHLSTYGPRADIDIDHPAVLRDDYFGYSFFGPSGAAVQAQRVPEYCQV